MTMLKVKQIKTQKLFERRHSEVSLQMKHIQHMNLMLYCWFWASNWVLVKSQLIADLDWFLESIFNTLIFWQLIKYLCNLGLFLNYINTSPERLWDENKIQHLKTSFWGYILIINKHNQRSIHILKKTKRQ